MGAVLMKNKYSVIIIKGRTAIFAVICLFACFGFIIFFMNMFSETDQPALKQQNSEFVILASNDLGMHCYQPDYSGFLILPPGNNLKVQVFQNDGEEAKLINAGIEVSYKIINNTTSADKINFWKYAADYGYDIEPDIGITGNGLSGKMSLSEDQKYYEATAIPVTPYIDGSTDIDPYQLASITVTDSKTGKTLAQINDVVVPVSNEMDCGICHGNAGTDKDILKKHDELSDTQLLADLTDGKRHKCSECHSDNILSEPGKPDILPLSQAMHGFHADKMAQSKDKPECYSCHPGPVSQCYRGVMYASGVSCVNSSCHGDMKNVAATQAEGRKAWLEEPDCGNCHGVRYGVNEGSLYRNSYLINNENAEMNEIILCESCHNSSHAEWRSTLLKDNLVPLRLQGYPGYINKCSVCHQGTGVIHYSIPKKQTK
jgi:hypothetical protein